MLRLESMPIITKALEKRKGVVFDFQSLEKKSVKERHGGNTKMMPSAINVGNSNVNESKRVGISVGNKCLL